MHQNTALPGTPAGLRGLDINGGKCTESERVEGKGVKGEGRWKFTTPSLGIPEYHNGLVSGDFRSCFYHPSRL